MRELTENQREFSANCHEEVREFPAQRREKCASYPMRELSHRGPECSVCGHPQRDLIDFALRQGEPQAAVARQFGCSRHAVNRHAHHLPPPVDAPTDPAGVQHELFDGFIRALARAKARLDDPALPARELGALMDQFRKGMAFLAKVAGAPLAAESAVDRELHHLRVHRAIAEGLADFPEALERYRLILKEVDG